MRWALIERFTYAPLRSFFSPILLQHPQQQTVGSHKGSHGHHGHGHHGKGKGKGSSSTANGVPPKGPKSGHSKGSGEHKAGAAAPAAATGAAAQQQAEPAAAKQQANGSSAAAGVVSS